LIFREKKYFRILFQNTKVSRNKKFFYENNHLIITKRYSMKTAKNASKTNLCVKKKEINRPEVIV
jgi:hypothetical protein